VGQLETEAKPQLCRVPKGDFGGTFWLTSASPLSVEQGGFLVKRRAAGAGGGGPRRRKSVATPPGSPGKDAATDDAAVDSAAGGASAKKGAPKPGEAAERDGADERGWDGGDENEGDSSAGSGDEGCGAGRATRYDPFAEEEVGVLDVRECCRGVSGCAAPTQSASGLAPALLQCASRHAQSAEDRSVERITSLSRRGVHTSLLQVNSCQYTRGGAACDKGGGAQHE